MLTISYYYNSNNAFFPASIDVLTPNTHGADGKHNWC